MKEKIRPIYSELQGYLSQAPEKNSGNIFEHILWEQINSAIEELNNVSNKNYDRFKISPRSEDWNGQALQIIDAYEYRLKISGLISRLHGEYFSDEVPPFSGMPSTSIQMNQQQNQSVQMQIILDTQDLVNKKIHETSDPLEKNFLEKIKSSLSSIKNVSDLISLILTTGSSLGMNLEQVLKLFK